VLRIVDLVEQLLLAGGFGHGAAAARDLGDDRGAVLADLADREAESLEVRHVLAAWIGEVPAGHLAGAFEEVADQHAAAQPIPVRKIPSKRVDQGPEE
jgi:hypothetical protein